MRAVVEEEPVSEGVLSIGRCSNRSTPYHQIGIWIGAAGPKMLRLIGRLGDGWSVPLQTYFPEARIREAQQKIDSAAKDSGRPPDSIIRIRNLAGIIDEMRKVGKVASRRR